ncbi:bacteriohemerythrin [uncultured Thiodictyon sp.]|uniref:bacteriohemerythrin n=1 Tax=uncultured Thiodictyon sp. TaxID=1846217 RepID=UPI0025FD2C0A|nr:bacteriohemerythrin [uncultured Thiodictyon sp.]
MKHLIEWSDALNVGIDDIDHRRKLFVGMAYEMHEAIQAHQSGEVVDDVLARLSDYTRVHFAAEEDLMRAIEYRGYKAHKDEHQDLIRSVGELQRKVAAGKATIGFELMHFLKVCLTDHIMWSDQQYVECVIDARGKANKKPRAGRLWQR